MRVGPYRRYYGARRTWRRPDIDESKAAFIRTEPECLSDLWIIRIATGQPDCGKSLGVERIDEVHGRSTRGEQLLDFRHLVIGLNASRNRYYQWRDQRLIANLLYLRRGSRWLTLLHPPGQQLG